MIIHEVYYNKISNNYFIILRKMYIIKIILNNFFIHLYIQRLARIN